MVRCVEKAKRVIQWGKLFLPLSSIRYYPPPFILRNPVLKGVTSAFKAGHEVAVMVFNLKNMNELAEQLGSAHHSHLIRNFKKYLRIYVEQEIDDQDIIALLDFLGEGFSLFIKVDYDRHFSNIDSRMKRIIFEVESKLVSLYPAVELRFETGYMFVEKKYYSTKEAVVRAHSQATAMAEKRVQSEFNEMMSRMNKIISDREIHLLAQPIIDVATKEIKAWEMLTRGPADTVLEEPLPLISVARQTGTLYQLEMLVFEKALQQIAEAKWHQDVFINFTPITLGNLRFIRDLKKIVEKYKNISPKQITIEITEQDSIEGMKNFNYNLKVLRLMGFRLAIDDTGAGYSNLSTISEIMPDFIKIDRSLIENIDKNALKESILKGLLLIAKEAGSLVVAEGIENAEEASVLTRNKVDLAQGYYYARPISLTNAVAP